MIKYLLSSLREAKAEAGERASRLQVGLVAVGLDAQGLLDLIWEVRRDPERIAGIEVLVAEDRLWRAKRQGDSSKVEKAEAALREAELEAVLLSAGSDDRDKAFLEELPFLRTLRLPLAGGDLSRTAGLELPRDVTRLEVDRLVRILSVAAEGIEGQSG